MEIIRIKEIESLIDDKCQTVGNLANICSYLFYNLENINWVGIYNLKDDVLQLGPFCGKVACTRIPITKGICGRAVRLNKTIVIDDVHKELDHIACDSESNSEIVIPLHNSKNEIIGVLDIDSPILHRFSDSSIVNQLEAISKIVEKRVF